MSVVVKSYNPKSHAPSVFIPAWLLQVKGLSLQAKILYGRLAQWSTTKATVHRSVNQLAEEIGTAPQTVKRLLKELRDVGLIETYRAEAGGHNHYRFLDHAWIHEELLDVYNYGGVGSEVSGGRVKSDPGVGSKSTLGRVKINPPKVKEIKVNKKNKRESKKPLPVDNFKNEDQKQKLTRETFQFTHEEQKESINRDIDIQKCFNKFLEYKPMFKRAEWESWFKREKNGRKAKNIHLEQQMNEHNQRKRLEMGDRAA